jgi:hypothetical protein
MGTEDADEDDDMEAEDDSDDEPASDADSDVKEQYRRRRQQKEKASRRTIVPDAEAAVRAADKAFQALPEDDDTCAQAKAALEALLAEKKAFLAQARANYQELRPPDAKLANAERDLAEAKAKLAKTKQDISDNQQAIAKLNDKNHRLRTQQQAQEAKLDRIQITIAALHAQIGKQAAADPTTTLGKERGGEVPAVQVVTPDLLAAQQQADKVQQQQAARIQTLEADLAALQAQLQEQAGRAAQLKRDAPAEKADEVKAVKPRT